MDAVDNTNYFHGLTMSLEGREGVGLLSWGPMFFFSDIVIPTRPTLGHSRFSELPNCSIQYEIRAGCFFHLAWEMRGLEEFSYAAPVDCTGFFRGWELSKWFVIHDLFEALVYTVRGVLGMALYSANEHELGGNLECN